MDLNQLRTEIEQSYIKNGGREIVVVKKTPLLALVVMKIDTRYLYNLYIYARASIALPWGRILRHKEVDPDTAMQKRPALLVFKQRGQ